MHIEKMGNNSYAIFNTIKNHNETHRIITEFLASGKTEMIIPVFQRNPRKALFGSNENLLDFFKVTKNQKPIETKITEIRTLSVSGKTIWLKSFLDSFHFEDVEDGHNSGTFLRMEYIQFCRWKPYCSGKSYGIQWKSWLFSNRSL